MADCSVGISPEEVKELRRMMVEYPRIMIALFGDGNGNAGLIPKFNDFFSRWDERQKLETAEREKLLETLAARDSRNRTWNLIIAIAALFVAVGVGVSTLILEYNRQVHTGMIKSSQITTTLARYER